MMYVILTELTTRPADQYAELEKAIKALGDWSQRVEGQWIVQSRYPATQIRDLLKQYIGANDKLFVARMAGSWAATNMGQGFPEWMGRRTFDAPPRR